MTVEIGMKSTRAFQWGIPPAAMRDADSPQLADS
jgi:hypothetical protein